MKNLMRSLYRKFDQTLPDWVLRRLDPEKTSIRAFVAEAAANVPARARVLDAGAGARPYAPLFAHAAYESTDIADPAGHHDFCCDLHAIPRPDAAYDAIVCNQVLEHVRDPRLVLAEFHRLLAPGGRLYLTVPLCWGVHEAPHHYYNFTRYGLEDLFQTTGFNQERLEARGGIFWFLGDVSRMVVPYIVKQQETPLRLALFTPLGLLLAPVTSYLLPVLLYELDGLDRQRDFTLGYAAVARKPFASL